MLVVDDEPEIAELIAGQLAPLDVTATIATSGGEALELLRSHRYDAITLDILMPGPDGFEVLRAIRQDPLLRTTPIVFVSVFSGSHALAGEWVVAKPIDADELRDVLGAAVRAGRSSVLVVGRPELQAMLEPALGRIRDRAPLGADRPGRRQGLRRAPVRGRARRRRHSQPSGRTSGS